MRFRIVVCSLAFLIAFYFLVLRILSFVQLFFEHSGIAITQDEIAFAHNTTSPDERSQVIPKIIHQVYHDWRKTGMPEDWEQLRQSCIEKNKDWEYVVSFHNSSRVLTLFIFTFLFLVKGRYAKYTQLWDETSSRNFLVTRFPWFLKTYDGYRYPVQRVDSVRYFLLRHFGGIYLDLDNVSTWHTDHL
jgi:mannosyltransferase OCH1-like enzyme